MPKFKPLNYREVIKILKNLGFLPEPTRSTSHQTWVKIQGKLHFAVTVYFHGTNKEFPDGTLGSIIRQSGVSKEKFYSVLKKKDKH